MSDFPTIMMPKLQKRQGTGWKNRLLFVIVWALCFVWHGSGAQNAAESADAADRNSSADEERNALLRENAELKAALAQRQTELEQLRGRFAELYIQSSRQAEQLTELQLHAAALLDGPRDRGERRVVADALAYAEDIRQARRKLIEQLRDFAQYLEAMLDVLQPSSGLRREMTQRFASILRVADRLEQAPSLVAGRDGVNVAAPRAGRVLAVNDELQIVVLDVGLADGIRSGTVWEIGDAGQVLAELRIIISRNAVSAAVPIHGRLERIAPGMEARLKASAQE